MDGANTPATPPNAIQALENNSQHRSGITGPYKWTTRTMVEQEYKSGFTFTGKDGALRTFTAGTQQVPQEVADSPYAQSFLKAPPPEDTAGKLPVYGTPGHEVAAFENRDLGPEEPVLGMVTASANGIEVDMEEEIPQPGELGPSTRVASGRRKATTSD